MKEFKLYPKFYSNLVKAIERGMNKNPQWKLTVATNNNPQLAMDWYMSGKTMDEFFGDILIYKNENKKWVSEPKPSTQGKINFR